MDRISGILRSDPKPALLIGNGINLFHGSGSSSWQGLLATLAELCDIDPPNFKTDEMSFTEFFDIVDLVKEGKDVGNLKQRVCDGLQHWEPSDQHRVIVLWAKRHGVPIVTVNFDENLSRSIDAEFHLGNKGKKGFTDWYPWSSYFSDREINVPRDSFAIWHAHGMKRYKRSIQLGLTDYMRSVRRADLFVNGRENSLRSLADDCNAGWWRGRDTWLDVIFFRPLLIFGFACNRDESFLRWLFLQRAGLHKSWPEVRVKAWFLDTQSTGRGSGKPGGGTTGSRRSGTCQRIPEGPTNKRFFEELDMEYVQVPKFKDIYENPAWRS